MSNGNIINLRNWFNSLPRSEQVGVLQFLYEGQLFEAPGGYLGRDPRYFTKGLYCGDAPSASSASNVCPTCGKPR